MKLVNTTNFPEDKIREIIQFVKPNNLPTSNFDVRVTNSSGHYQGTCYDNGCGRNTMYNDDGNTNKISWIERLLDTPLADNRKYCVWRILTPYLLNKRKMPSHVAFNIIQEWLHRCNKLRRLDFNMQYRVNDSIERAVSKYMPVAYDKLREENPDLYEKVNAVSGV
jgi:Primase X